MTSTDKRAHYQVTFLVLAVGVAAYALLQSLVIPVLPEFRTALHTTQGNVTWVLTAYLLSASIFTPIMGRIGDMVGKKRIFVITLGFLTLGCLIGALATNLAVMILARVIQGVGGGLIPLAFGIIRDEFPPERVTGTIATISALTAVGSGAGTVLAGPIVDALNYHWLFWLPLITTAVAGVAAYFVVPESPVRTPGRISWTPAVLLSGWLICLLLALSEAPSWGWLSGKVLGLVAAAIVLAVAWVFSETRAATPLIDMTMMRLRGVWTTNVVALLVGVGMYSSFAFVPEFAQMSKETGYGLGASITVSGLVMLPSTVASFVAGIYTGRLVRSFGGRWAVSIGCLVGAASMAGVALVHHSLWQLAVAIGVSGLGFGVAFAAMSGLIVMAVPQHQTGVASGMNANIRTIGGSIGAAVMSSIVSGSVLRSGLPKESGFTAGFLMLVGAMVLASAAALIIPNLHEPRDLPSDEPEHAELAIVPGGTVVGDKPE